MRGRSISLLLPPYCEVFWRPGPIESCPCDWAPTPQASGWEHLSLGLLSPSGYAIGQIVGGGIDLAAATDDLSGVADAKRTTFGEANTDFGSINIRLE